jgi:hypothetical protein
MSKRNRDVEVLRQIDNDLMVQYEELLGLRAQLANVLFALKRSPPRRQRITRSNRSAARAGQRNERPVSSRPILLVISERPSRLIALCPSGHSLG